MNQLDEICLFLREFVSLRLKIARQKMIYARNQIRIEWNWIKIGWNRARIRRLEKQVAKLRQKLRAKGVEPLDRRAVILPADQGGALQGVAARENLIKRKEQNEPHALFVGR